MVGIYVGDVSIWVCNMFQMGHERNYRGFELGGQG